MKSKLYSVPSFAKINWRLHILGKRTDGYHELRTVLQTISLRDDLYFLLPESDEIVLECNRPEIPTDSSNLIIRAALALKRHFGINAGAHIRLEKRIPTQAGLGGGSSNAAVTLVALAGLWDLKLQPETLFQLAAGLGADVPFFLQGGTVLAEGIGERLLPLDDVAAKHLIVVKPLANVATVEAYEAMNCDALTTSGVDPILSSSPSARFFSDLDPDGVVNDLSNDFESVIFEMEPEIKRARDALVSAGAGETLLAGSGSSVFGVFADPQTQQIAMQKIRLEAGWQTFSCVTLSRSEYVRALSIDEHVSLLRFSKFVSDIGA